jgi:chromosome condensin MukBEF complex kleisin-like MukF subunit
MGKIRRGNFIFVTWVGDHAPRHVHVFSRGRLVVKFDLDRNRVMEGRINRRILKLLDELRAEGRL